MLQDPRRPHQAIEAATASNCSGPSPPSRSSSAIAGAEGLFTTSAKKPPSFAEADMVVDHSWKLGQ
eukprot:3490942-Pyramimonas_sp.AAC.1